MYKSHQAQAAIGGSRAVPGALPCIDVQRIDQADIYVNTTLSAQVVRPNQQGLQVSKATAKMSAQECAAPKVFGSFFTASVQQMISAADWTDPPLPERVQRTRDMAATFSQAFGEAARSQFMIDFKNFTFVNHGAFGACMRVVLDEGRCWQEHCERQPLRFMDRSTPSRLVESPVWASQLNPFPVRHIVFCVWAFQSIHEPCQLSTTRLRACKWSWVLWDF
jgi:hypothetical protein